MRYYSVVRLYENGITRKEYFPWNIVSQSFVEKFLDYRKETHLGIKMISLCFSEDIFVIALYFINGKFAFALRPGVFSPVEENYIKESYFKIFDKFCEENLAEYKDVLLNVEKVDVETATVTLRKYSCSDCVEAEVSCVCVDVSKLRPVEVVVL